MKRILLVTILLFAGICSATAGTTGKITGRITDVERSEPVLGVNVLVVGTSLGASTDIDGYFSIINIPPGKYELQSSCVGYQTIKVSGVIVNVDKTTKLDMAMRETAVTVDAVEIVAAREGVIRDLTSTLVRVSADEIQAMPIENLSDVMRLQAGMTTDAGGGLHARGGRSSEIKYYLDGMSVSNSYGGGQAIVNQVNNIQEMQMISGTFNAEYGQAMSQIVNIVTKEGSSDKTLFSLSGSTGGFLSAHTDKFLYIDHFNPLSQKILEGTLSGPVPFLHGSATYFISARLRDEDDWLFGRRDHSISDTADFTNVDPAQWTAQYTGDGSYVPMSSVKDISLQGKLTFYPFAGLKSTNSITWRSSKGQGYNHLYRYTPDFLATNYADEINFQGSITHTISNDYFQEFKYQYHVIHSQEHSRENPFDPAYTLGIKQRTTPSDIFFIGGIDPHFVNRHDNNAALKYELTGQIDRYDLVKVGAELNLHFIEDEYFEVIRTLATNWQLRIDPLTAFNHNYYNKKPIEAAAYIQDKIEFNDIIVNVGFRYDYFDPQSYVPTDLTDPANKRKDAGGNLRSFNQAYRAVKPKEQFSPRIGLAFPITDNGKIHVSYGHFFQMPDIYRMYQNPEYEIDAGDFKSYIGNADLEAQRTVMYEIGVQQRISADFIVDATCFYKDIRNLLGVENYETFDADRYSRYANTDYGNVSGITVSLELLKTGMLSGSFDYTYQIAEGNGSDPLQAFHDAFNKAEATKTLIPLNWDMRHVVNGTVNLHGDSWMFVCINQFHAGLPFTPITTYSRTENIQMRNQGRLESEYTMDIRFTKQFLFDGIGTNLWILVNNVFDSQRYDLAAEIPYRELLSHQAQMKDRFNSIYEYRADPGRQPRPRMISLGVGISL